MSDLKPCPFCGGEPGWIVRFDNSLHHKLWSLRCHCGIESPEFAAEDLVVRHWNRRAPSDREAKLVEAVRGVLKNAVYSVTANSRCVLEAALRRYEEGA